MSYTMTIESPEKAAWFEQRYSKLSQAQLGSLFISLLMQTRPEILEGEVEQPVPSHIHALRGIVKLPVDFDERDCVRQRNAILSVDKESGKANKFRALCRELPPSGLPKGYVFSRDEVSERESRCLT